MSFANYIKKAMRMQGLMPHFRAGQAFFNVLAEVRPDLADKVRGHIATDPFYVDENLQTFFEYILIEWDS